MRDESAFVLGILLAGLFQVEQEAASQVEPDPAASLPPKRLASEASGVWRVGSIGVDR